MTGRDTTEAEQRSAGAPEGTPEERVANELVVKRPSNVGQDPVHRRRRPSWLPSGASALSSGSNCSL